MSCGCMICMVLYCLDCTRIYVCGMGKMGIMYVKDSMCYACYG